MRSWSCNGRGNNTRRFGRRLSARAVSAEERSRSVERQGGGYWQGESLELSRRLHQEACRRGLGRARQKLILADGAAWIWNAAQDRWSGAVELLDFYHASQHLWDLGKAVQGGAEVGARLGGKGNCINCATVVRQKCCGRLRR